MTEHKIPYGWQLTENSDEQEVIQAILEWVEQGYSYRKIARHLAEQSVSGNWYHAKIAHIVERRDRR